MAERKNPQFGSSGWYQNYSSDLLKGYVAQALGTNAVAPSTSPASTAPDAKMARRAERKAAIPYTSEQIAADPNLSMLKNALSTMTYEQALANYRALTKVTNMIPLAKANESAKYKSKATQMVRRATSAMAKLTPEQRAAEQIFFAMGGSLQSTNPQYGGYGMGTPNASLYKSLGLTPPTTNYAPVSYTPSGPNLAMRLANPLSATQRSRLQRLRGMAPSSLSAKQKAALARLRAKKNAPTILP